MILGEILIHLPGRLRQLAEGRDELPRRWSRLDTLMGVPVRVEVGGEVIRGVGAGIDGEGALRIASPGEMRILHAGRVLRE